jgi:hypothetical protein
VFVLRLLRLRLVFGWIVFLFPSLSNVWSSSVYQPMIPEKSVRICLISTWGSRNTFYVDRNAAVDSLIPSVDGAFARGFFLMHNGHSLVGNEPFSSFDLASDNIFCLCRAEDFLNAWARDLPASFRDQSALARDQHWNVVEAKCGDRSPLWRLAAQFSQPVQPSSDLSQETTVTCFPSFEPSTAPLPVQLGWGLIPPPLSRDLPPVAYRSTVRIPPEKFRKSSQRGKKKDKVRKPWDLR